MNNLLPPHSLVFAKNLVLNHFKQKENSKNKLTNIHSPGYGVGIKDPVLYEVKNIITKQTN